MCACIWQKEECTSDGGALFQAVQAVSSSASPVAWHTAVRASLPCGRLPRGMHPLCKGILKDLQLHSPAACSGAPVMQTVMLLAVGWHLLGVEHCSIHVMPRGILNLQLHLCFAEKRLVLSGRVMGPGVGIGVQHPPSCDEGV